MKRFLGKLSLLVLLLALSVWSLNRLGVRAGAIYKDGAAMVCETKRHLVRAGISSPDGKPIDVLLMGSSKILAGVIPPLFDGLNGDRTLSYNLAMPALPVSSSYFLLKDWLVRNPAPEYLVMELYVKRGGSNRVFNYYAVQGMEGFEEPFSYLVHLRDKSIVVDWLFPFKMYWSHVPRYLYDALARPGSAAALKAGNREILERMKEQRGYYYIAEQAVGGPKKRGDRVPDRGEDYEPFEDYYVGAFFDLAQRHGIKVLLIQPACLEDQYRPYETMPLQFRAVLGRFPNVYMADGGWQIKGYGYEFFSDKDHLNPGGAARYTGEIAAEFRSVFFEK